MNVQKKGRDPYLGTDRLYITLCFYQKLLKP